MLNKFTKNTQNGDFAENLDAIKHNLNVLCNSIGGDDSNPGEGTWGSGGTTVTISDSRVTPTSRIKGFTVYGSIAKNGMDWRVTSRQNGQFTITSDTPETEGCTFWFDVINV